MAKRLACKRWSCAACAEARKADWLDRFLRAISEGPPGVMFCFRGAVENWGKVKKAINRLDGKFVKVSGDDGSLLVLSTVYVDDAEAVNEDEAIDLFVKALQALPLSRNKHPVQPSRGWMKPTKQDPRWYGGEVVPASDQQLVATVKALADEGVIRMKVLDAGAVLWWFPDDTTENDRGAIRRKIFGHVMSMSGKSKEGDSANKGQRAV